MQSPPPTQEPDPAHTKGAFAGVLAIASVYVYFLIFAEFAFIENLREIVHDAGIKPLMAALGTAGIAGSIIAAKWFSPACGRRQLSTGFICCALAAGLSLLANNQILAIASAVAVGSSLAWTTVMLVLCLRPSIQLKRLGLCCGLGTGLAYAFCNQPFIFNATPRIQTVIALIAAVVGFVFSLQLRNTPVEKSTSADYTAKNTAVWIVLFLTLVWIDSAAFFIIQHNQNLKLSTWAGASALQSNAIVHFLAALLAGVVLDRRLQPLAVGTALLALLAACTLLHHSVGAFPAARILYTAGVSIYSTALIFHPARGNRPWLAGLLYAAAGWFGSAMGIGMVQSLQEIPLSFVVIAAFVASAAFLVRHFGLKRRPPNHCLLLLLTAAVFLAPQKIRAEDPFVILGRETYISEGCIHCHSQYVRPGTNDIERWGPESSLAETLKQQPPLYGNRRQGPDLSRVGSRRTPEWNRLHLIAPRSLTPGSRMPSYAHLFKENSPRGDALVAYLATLGGEMLTERLHIAQTWRPADDTLVLSPGEQKARFNELCASCHGEGGQGDGPLSNKLSLRPPDFTRDPWRHVNEFEPELELQLTRIVKFGWPSTPMAGHEYLTDREVVSLARFILALHKGNPNH